MKRHLLSLSIAVLGLGAVAWALVQGARGPQLPAYEVSAQPLVQTVVATGRVVAMSGAEVGTAVTGVVLERRVQEGDVVQVGDVLAVLRADDLEAALNEAEAALAQLQQSTRPQAEAALREAEARLEQASRELERRRELVERKLLALEALEQATQAETVARSAADQARVALAALEAGNPAEAAARARVANARAQLDKTQIRAEVAGTVLTRNAEPGDLVQPGRVLFEIAPLGDTELLVPLDERNLEVLALGQRAQVVADAFPTQPFAATVSFIAPSVDAQRGTIDVRLTPELVPAFLRQGMTVSVNVETGRRPSALVVPNDALSSLDGDHAELWLVVDGRATRRNVQLGLRGLGHSEVANGLQAGDWVLADAQAPLDEGARVRAVPATPQAAAAASNDMPLPFN